MLHQTRPTSHGSPRRNVRLGANDGVYSGCSSTDGLARRSTARWGGLHCLNGHRSPQMIQATGSEGGQGCSRTARGIRGFAVDDIEASRARYGERLGLDVRGTQGDLRLHLAGRDGHSHLSAAGPCGRVLHGPQLPSRGHRSRRGRTRAVAWFKEPAGNTLSLIEEEAS